MPSKNWGKQKEWPPKGAENKIVNEDTLKSKLDKMSIKGLRDYVKDHNLEAKNNDKEKLINEILEEVK